MCRLNRPSCIAHRVCLENKQVTNICRKGADELKFFSYLTDQFGFCTVSQTHLAKAESNREWVVVLRDEDAGDKVSQFVPQGI